MEKAFLVTFKTNLDRIIKDNSINRIYFGDSECEFNFLSILSNKDFLSKLIKSGKKLTLLSPHMTEDSLIKFKKLINNHIYTFFEKEVIGEIVINDLGILFVIKKLFLDKLEIIYGNYLFIQRKDPLLRKKNIDSLINIDYQMYNKFFKNEKIKYLELYNSYFKINIENLDIGINLYYPYIIQSTTRYCLRNLLYNKINYMKIIEECNGCYNKQSYKFTQDLLNKKIYNSGNKYYYSNFSYKNITKNINRVIYNYDLI